MALTQVQSGILADSTQTYGIKNRIINGDMRVWQRATSVTGSTGYNSVDRWDINGTTSTLNVAQSTDAPAGFTYSTAITVGTASSASGAYSYMVQQIEGYNWADLNYGSASAATSTLSFWVKSSVTGTYGLSFRNTSSARFYTTTYTINSANTWEQKTITITGDTSGTWLKTNGSGFSVFWDLGIGSTYSSASNNAWSTVGSNYFGVTSTTKLASTSGATFYITGIQLEKGSTATQFDYRSFGTELQLCQRYTWVTNSDSISTGIGNGGTNPWCNIVIPIPMRATPTLAVTGQLCISDQVSVDAFAASPSITDSNLSSVGGRVRIAGWGVTLTSNRVYTGTAAGGSGKLTFTAEL